MIDYDYPFWLMAFQLFGDGKWAWPREVRFQATVESINGMVMDSFCCLTPRCDFESQVASDCYD